MKTWKRLLVLIWALLLAFAIPCAASADNSAREIAITVSAGGETYGKLTDGSYDTTVTFSEGTTIVVAPENNEERIYGLYIVWAACPGEWTLRYGNIVSQQGTHGFLHEYVSVEGGAESVAMELMDREKLCYIKAYSEGTLPEDVQVWEPECEMADILLFSTHADDEILFFGGILPEYAGERGLLVQVVYFSNYFGGTVIREHEKLDGLWTCGVRNYPVNGPFEDVYSETLSEAKKIFGYDDTLSFIVEQIRRFRPLVCVAQDVNGEYGHGTHMLTSAAMQEAVEISMDMDKYPDSVEKYGLWEVPKTYLHLYEENPLTLDCRKPLASFGGKTALEVASEAYKKHVSQQWCWFYVSDDYKYSIARFGLYRTTVGADETGDDLMEHLQDRCSLQREVEEKRAERLAREDEEWLAREEAELLAIEEASKAGEERPGTEEPSLDNAAPENDASASEQYSTSADGSPVSPVFFAGAAVLVILIGALIVMVHERRFRARREQGDEENENQSDGQKS